MYVINYSGLHGAGMYRVWGKREMRTVFWWKKPKKKEATWMT